MPTNNLLVLKKALLSLSIGWTVLIAFLCLITFSDLPPIGVSGADKYVHVTFHFVFIVLWGFYVSSLKNEISISKIIRLVIISVLYGIAIEFLQETLTTARRADIFDVLANFTGAILGLTLFLLIKRQKKSNNRL